MSKQLRDPFGREFPYLRLSITDVCNFSCQYCLPDGYHCDEKKSYLTLNEIKNLVSAFASVGTRKVRVTGGEPGVRKDLVDIIRTISDTPGIQQVAITTNGYRLGEQIEDWVDAGLTHLNVSVDSLDPKLFADLTGHNRLLQILQDLQLAASLPLKKIKLNAVLLKSINSNQFQEYAEFVRERDIGVRFIELMRTGDNASYFNRFHVSADTLRQFLFDQGWTKIQPGKSAGPAEEYRHKDFRGNFGLIAPYAKNFCDSCNRLRISSTGDFHLCLFGDRGYPVRELLQSSQQQQELCDTLHHYLQHKRKGHYLHSDDPGITPHLASVGG